MARKRLNKKVAFVGSVVLALFVLAGIVLILHFFGGPEKFIEDGDVAAKAARQATDEQIRQQEYEKAARSYNVARKRAKSDSLRIKILFKLVDIYLETEEWKNVVGCLNQIVRIEPNNVKARLARLNYFYIVADSGSTQIWREVVSQAAEFIEIVEKEELLDENIDKWQIPGIEKTAVETEKMGPYLYLVRARAYLEMTRRGATTDLDESIAQAIDDLEKVRELAPDNVGVYFYLSQAAITKGQILASRGNLEERDKATENAIEFLEQAVEVAGDDPRTHVNLLIMKLNQSSRDQMQSFEPEFLALVQKFESSAEAFSALAGFYQLLGPKKLDKVIEATEKAIELDKENVPFAIASANLHYYKFLIYGQNNEIDRAIEVARNALTLPDAKDKPGPRNQARVTNRIRLYDFLATCYIEQILEPSEETTQAQTQEWLTNAENAVHEIEQIIGSGEDPRVIRWQGMLELAKRNKGDRNIDVRKLYSVYEQLRASGIEDKPPSLLSVSYAHISYSLARIFKNTSEVGAAAEFLASALKTGVNQIKPEAHLDYAEVLLRLNYWPGAIASINVFEQEFGANQRSQKLRIRAYIGANQFDDAEEKLASASPDDPDTIKLNLQLTQAKIRQVRNSIALKQTRQNSDTVIKESSAVPKESVEAETSVQLMTEELKNHWIALAGWVQKLLQMDPNSISEASIIAVCNNYIAEGEKSKAENLVNQFLEYSPDNIRILFYKRALSEPEPDNIPQQRRKEIEEQVLSNINDPIRRSLNLGAFYQSNNELNKAAGEFKKVLKIDTSQEDVIEIPPLEQNKETADLQSIAAGYLFDIAIMTEDWQLAEQIAQMVRRGNIDNCEGNFFAARLNVAKEQYKNAIERLDECLKFRPVFSNAFMLRSRVNAVLGNDDAAITDLQKAASLNPMDRNIARARAIALAQRNQKLGENASSDQITEADVALNIAIRLNPRDLQLLSFYSEYISSTEPLKALAFRQNLQKNAPSMENALLLGRMAMRMAIQETDDKRKEALFAMAVSSFDEALAYDPQDKVVLESYAEYYRVTGQPEKAQELLEQAKDQKLLWRHYYRSGQLEQARRTLQQLYQSQTKDIDVVIGLLLIADKTADKEAVKKYSEELLLLEDNAENNLLQIQTFLKIGLIKEAEYKLQSFKEKYRDDPRALLLEASLAMKQGQLKRALELTNQNLQTNQDDARAWRLRGQINQLMANYDQAIVDLEKSKLLSYEPDTSNTLARAYMRVGREEKAITELKNTIDRPQAPPTSRVLLEQIYIQLDRKDDLKKFYDKTLEKFPDSVFWYNRAAAFAIEQSDFSSAELLYQKAWNKSTNSSQGSITALDGYLQALVLSGKQDKVLQEARKHTDSDFGAIAYFRMAEAKQKLEDKEDSIKYCRYALDKAAKNEVLIAEISQRINSLLGEKEALRCGKERLQDNPESLAANFTMFNLTKINGQYNKAIGYIDKCLNIVEPDSKRIVGYKLQKAEVLYMAYDKTADNNYLHRAIEEYESLLDKMPNNVNVLNNFAYMLAENDERPDKALEYAKRAYESKPNNPSFLDTYAYALYKNGRLEEAAEFLQSALQQYENSSISAPADVYEHLGIIKEELGSKNEALAAYKQALAIGADKSSEKAKDRIKKAVERLSH